MEATLLRDVVVILGLALIVVYVGQKFGIPTAVGLFLTGILAGPRGLQLVQGVHEVEVMAEIGVVLLLFTIGLEISLTSLLRSSRTMLAGGFVQLAIMLGGAVAVSRLLGEAWAPAILLGFVLSASSTAIVLRLIQSRGDLDAPYGRASLGILVFQDLMIVPIMLILPLVAGSSDGLAQALGLFLLKGAVAIGFSIVAARSITPRILEAVVRTGSRELFVITVIGICLTVGWLASLLGLPLALGAFLAGVIVSESEYSHQAVADVLPFRELFTAFFFVSIGMLLDPAVLLRQPGLAAGIVAAAIAGKMIAGGAAAVAMRLPLRSVLLVAVALGQVGEFSFVIAEAGFVMGIIGEERYQLFLAAAVLSMALTPFLLPLAHWAADRLPARLEEPQVDREGAGPDPRSLQDHVVIIGFGLNGRNLAEGCRRAGITFVVIDLNPDRIAVVREMGGVGLFGDATQLPVLEAARVEHARVVIVALSDASATRRSVRLIRSLCPAGHVVVRTRYLSETEPLLALGADHVIPEELETSIEILSLVLGHYLIPRDEIAEFVAKVRAGNYAALRSPFAPSPLDELELSLADLEVATLRAETGGPLVGLTLRESKLRQDHGVTIVAVRRDGHVEPNPGAEQRIEPGDVLTMLGLPQNIVSVQALLRAPTD